MLLHMILIFCCYEAGETGIARNANVQVPSCKGFVSLRSYLDGIEIQLIMSIFDLLDFQLQRFGAATNVDRNYWLNGYHCGNNHN